MSIQQSNRFSAFDGAGLLCITIDSENCRSPSPDKYEYESIIALNKLNKICDSTPNITIPTINFSKDSKDNLRNKENKTNISGKIFLNLSNNPLILKAISDYIKGLKIEISGMENNHVLISTFARRIAHSLCPTSLKNASTSINYSEYKFNASNIKPFIPRKKATQASMKINEMNPISQNVQGPSN